MQIDGNTLLSMAEFEVFKEKFIAHAKDFARGACLRPIFSLPRLRDAHYAWRDDLSRLTQHEKNLGGGLDHFKQCAHLAYWLRRLYPIADYEDIAAAVGEVDDLYPDEQKRRNFIVKYGSEYLAFDFGFQICSYYALERTDNPMTAAPELSTEYLVDVCHMLKFKHVSPHSMYLIYKSLLMGLP